jgi:hypothetical protein
MDRYASDELGAPVAPNSHPTTLELGPKFHIRERVLAVDSQQLGDAVVAEGSGRPPPLYEATVLKSGLRCIDPISGAIILPDRKMKGHSRHQNNPAHRRRRDLGGDGYGDGGDAREWCHLIHFHGWNSRHDCWIREADVFHDTLENRTRVGAKVPVKQKEGVDESKKNKRRGGLMKVNKCAEDVALAEDVRSVYDKNLILITRACKLPFTLQTILVDEGENITKRVCPPPVFNRIDNWTEEQEQHRGISMLHAIPAKRNIIDVIGEYVRDGKRHDLEAFSSEPKKQRIEEDRRKASADVDATDRNHGEVAMSKDNDPNKDDGQSSSYSKQSTKAILKLKRKKLKQFALSIIALFDVSLPQFLLYKEERVQYESIAGRQVDCDRANATDAQGREGAQKRPSELYGAEHLLRFLVKLPFILSLYDCRDANSGRSLGNNEESTPKDVFILASDDLSRDFSNHISNLVVFLQKHLFFFSREYIAV